MSTLHYFEYLSTVYTQQIFVLLVVLESASSCVHTMLRVSTVLLSADAYTVISSCSVLNGACVKLRNVAGSTCCEDSDTQRVTRNGRKRTHAT